MYLTKGRVQQDEITNQGLNIANLSSGAYILVIKNNGKAYKTKLIKK